MVLIEEQLSATGLLRIFHQDAPYLFMGSAFITVGIMTEAFCLLRRRFDALLVWLGVFAILYGLRMWFDTGMLHLAIADNEPVARLRWAVNFLVPIPAFLFFRAAGLLERRRSIVTAILLTLFTSLALLVFVVGRLPLLHTINNILVIVALPWVMVRTFLMARFDRNFVIIRWGLGCFVLLAIWDNTMGAALLHFSLEPYGFAVLLASLGYVAAKQTLQRDQQLGEIQQELELAQRIQLSILPAGFPHSAAFQVAARYVPMSSVAGDFYEFLAVDSHRAGLLIADVSGHGVPAALIASMGKMAAIAQRKHAESPAQVLTGMNEALCGNTQGQYVTAAYVHVDAETRQLRYSAAGHPAMLRLREGKVDEIVENGLLLAASQASTYSEINLPMQSGDRLLLYTDGLIEARNDAGEMFGEKSLTATLLDTANLSPEKAAEQIIASVQKWAKLQDDDLTVVICDFTGAN